MRYAPGTGAWTSRRRANRAVFECATPQDARLWARCLVDASPGGLRDEAKEGGGLSARRPAPRVALMRTLAGRQYASSRRAPVTPGRGGGRRLSPSFWEPRGGAHSDHAASPATVAAAADAKGCLNGKHRYRGPPIHALEAVAALLERLVATVKFFVHEETDEVLEARLEAVRESTAFAAFEEAAAALRAVDLDADLADDGAKHAFWINAHNLCVLHGCVANGAPQTATAFAPVPAYLAWARRQRYAFGDAQLSAIEIEHALLRRGDIYKGQLAIALLLPRFPKDDRRARLKPSRPPPTLALSLFAATASSAPLRIVRKAATVPLRDELMANAADFLRKTVSVSKASVGLPAALRFNAQDLGKDAQDILSNVDRLLRLDKNPFSWFEINDVDPTTAKLDFATYDWSPKLDIHWGHCAASHHPNVPQ